MDIESRWPLLGGLTPAQFMRRHWQKKPLLVRQAWPDVQPPLPRPALFALAAQEGVESRLVVQDPQARTPWTMRRGPLPRRALPPLTQPRWSLLVQGLDLHVPAAHEMLSRFRFLPDARMDDLMVSYATDGGGVGPHLDSYDVFLIQVEGRRRWRVGRVKDDSLVPGLPVRLLQNFEPEDEWLLEPGDMLYLPPRWGHDGVAQGPCMTCSVGFRVPSAASLAGELLARLADTGEALPDRLYRDPGQPATVHPAHIPQALRDFAVTALEQRLKRSADVALALGEILTEPKPTVWFEPGGEWVPGRGVVLDRRTRMMYDERHVFINGESFDAAGADARAMARLADARCMDAAQVARLSEAARNLLREWVDDGWLHAQDGSA